MQMLWKIIICVLIKNENRSTVVGGRKIKQLDLERLGYEGFGTCVFACCMRQILLMRRSNKTASTVFQIEYCRNCFVKSGVRLVEGMLYQFLG